MMWMSLCEFIYTYNYAMTSKKGRHIVELLKVYGGSPNLKIHDYVFMKCLITSIQIACVGVDECIR